MERTGASGRGRIWVSHTGRAYIRIVFRSLFANITLGGMDQATAMEN